MGKCSSCGTQLTNYQGKGVYCSNCGIYVPHDTTQNETQIKSGQASQSPENQPIVEKTDDSSQTDSRAKKSA